MAEDAVPQTPSGFTINYATILTSRSDEEIDIVKMINYVEVFESIYAPFITMKVNILDAMSLNSLLPIIGEEYLEIDIVGIDGEVGMRNQGFYIYKITDRIVVSDRATSYTLHCISAPAIVDMNIKISKSYKGLASDIVRDQLCTDSLSIKKELYCHPTKNSISYISNYWSPMQNIKYICDRAVSADTKDPSYLFYETKKSFLFIPLDTLVSQPASFDFLYVNNPHSPDMLNSTEDRIIQKMYVDDQFDYIDRVMSGAYGNRTLTVNTTNKRYAYSYYDFLDAFSTFARLNPSPMSSEKATRRINSMFRVRTFESLSVDGMPSEMNQEWFSQRITELAAINSQTVFIDVSGRMNIYAGNVVNLVVPMTHIAKSDSGEKDLGSLIDKTLSGRYLVTSIKHKFDRERHTISLQINKDSMFKGITDNA